VLPVGAARRGDRKALRWLLASSEIAALDRV